MSVIVATGEPSNAFGPRRLRAALALGVMLAGLALLLARPQFIIRVLPQLAKVYALAGFPVNLRGLAFDHVTARFEEVGGERYVSVDGVLRNVARVAKDAPRLRISLIDAAGHSVYAWTATTGIRGLKPGETAPFRARLASPPAEAKSVTVDFMADETQPL